MKSIIFKNQQGQLIISKYKFAVLSGLFFLATNTFISCSKANNNNEMKSPTQAGNPKNESSDQKTISVKQAKENTLANMQEAFNGESNATARYAAFSKKASEEGFTQIALLFKAASFAENIHANNHKAVLEEMGVAVKPAVLDVKVQSTKENLEFAIKGETYEATTMYPNFLKDASAAGNQLALISLNYAYKTEKKHKVFYEQALAALNSNTTNTLASTYFVCPTCGNTYETTAPKRCGISMTSGEKFVKINSL